MSDLSGKRIKNTFADILKVTPDTDNSGVDSTLRPVTDGDGTAIPLNVSTSTIQTDSIDINGGAIDGTSIGAASTSTGAFTTLAASSTLGVTGIATLSDATQSTNTTTGGLIVSGGAGIAKNANVGGDLSVAGNATVTGNLTVNGTPIGIDDPDTIIAKQLGINGSPEDDSQFSIHTTEHHSNTAYRPHGFAPDKTYHDVNGYFVANIDNKFNWTALEFLPLDGDTVGSAWWELELWVDESDPEAAGMSGSGSDYVTAPMVRVVPGRTEYFPDNDGAWAPNTSVLDSYCAVYWAGSIGYIYLASIQSASGYATTGTTNPLGVPSSPSTYYTTLVENSGSSDEITWTYLGQTANITANLGTGVNAGTVVSFDVNDDSDGETTGWLQGFIYEAYSAEADFFATDEFFDTGSHNDGTKPVTLERGVNGGINPATVGVTYSVNSVIGMGYINLISLKIIQAGGNISGDGNISEGDDWILVQRNSAGADLRHIKLKANIKGGRGQGGRIVVSPPTDPDGFTAYGYASTLIRYRGSPWGISSITPSFPIGEQPPGRFAPTGERTYFSTCKGFIMSRAGYDTTLGTVVGGILEWWRDAKQKQFKKAQILDNIPYGNTNLGHMHNYDPTYITPALSEHVHAKNKFDRAAGKIYNLTGSNNSNWAITESTTQAVFFRATATGTSEPQRSYTTESYGGASDYEFNETIYKEAYANAIALGESVATATDEAKAATLEFPNFGNVGAQGGAAPGGHTQINMVMASALDLMSVQSAQNGALNMDFPEGTNEGSFFLMFSSSNPVALQFGIGYRLKCWTTPGYIVNLRRTIAKYD